MPSNAIHKQGIKFNTPKNYQDTNVSSKVLRHIISLTK